MKLLGIRSAFDWPHEVFVYDRNLDETLYFNWSKNKFLRYKQGMVKININQGIIFIY